MKSIFSAQAQGTRKQQQDSYGEFISNDPKFLVHAGILAVVADGMGGLEMGADASKLAINSFIHAYQKKKESESIQKALKRSAIHANKSVFNFSESQGLSGKTGSTLVALVRHGNEIFWISVGDSRVYKITKNKILQLSKDHNYENELMELVKSGEMTIEDVKNNSQRAALTSFIGAESISKIDQNKSPVISSGDDIFLLASDGFFAKLTDAEILNAVKASNRDDLAKNLIKLKLAKKLKNQDNLTVTTIFPELSKKNKNPKLIAIWIGLILFPLIGISYLQDDLFFINYLKNQLTDSADEANQLSNSPPEEGGIITNISAIPEIIEKNAITNEEDLISKDKVSIQGENLDETVNDENAKRDISENVISNEMQEEDISSDVVIINSNEQNDLKSGNEIEIIEIEVSKNDDVVYEGEVNDTNSTKSTPDLQKEIKPEISSSIQKPKKCFQRMPPSFDPIEVPCEEKMNNTGTINGDSEELNDPVIQNCRKKSDQIDSTNRLLKLCDDEVQVIL